MDGCRIFRNGCFGVGMVLILAAMAFSTWAMVVNRFFSGTVRIQTERGHQVVSSGPYRLIRHPGYLSGVVGYLAMPMILGSSWAYLPVFVGILVIVLRTCLEDKTLQEELPGYREYTQTNPLPIDPGDLVNALSLMEVHAASTTWVDLPSGRCASSQT